MHRRRRLQNRITDSGNNEVEALLEVRSTRDEESKYQEDEEDISMHQLKYFLSYYYQ